MTLAQALTRSPKLRARKKPASPRSYVVRRLAEIRVARKVHSQY